MNANKAVNWIFKNAEISMSWKSSVTDVTYWVWKGTIPFRMWNQIKAEIMEAGGKTRLDPSSHLMIQGIVEGKFVSVTRETDYKGQPIRLTVSFNNEAQAQAKVEAEGMTFEQMDKDGLFIQTV